MAVMAAIIPARLAMVATVLPAAPVLAGMAAVMPAAVVVARLRRSREGDSERKREGGKSKGADRVHHDSPVEGL